MTQRMHYYCDCGDDDCTTDGRSINEHDEPIVLYLVAGHVNGGGEIDKSKLPPFVARMLDMPVPRIEMHAACAPKVLARLLAEKAPEPESEPESGRPENRLNSL